MTITIKKLIPKPIRDFLGLYEYRVKRDLRYFYYILKRQIRRVQRRDEDESIQQFIFTFDSDFSFGSIEQLIATLEHKKIKNNGTRDQACEIQLQKRKFQSQNTNPRK